MAVLEGFAFLARKRDANKDLALSYREQQVSSWPGAHHFEYSCDMALDNGEACS